MARGNGTKLTPLEAQIMDCVWNLGETTVRQARAALQPARPLAYNTVLTMMQILRDKGFLLSERVGKTDVYRAAVSRELMARHSLREVADRFFAGSVRALVSQLLDTENLTEDEIKAVRREVDKKLREQTRKERREIA